MSQWAVNYPVNYAADGDKTNEAIYKHIQEVARLYSLLGLLRCNFSGAGEPDSPEANQLYINPTNFLGRVYGADKAWHNLLAFPMRHDLDLHNAGTMAQLQGLVSDKQIVYLSALPAATDSGKVVGVDSNGLYVLLDGPAPGKHDYTKHSAGTMANLQSLVTDKTLVFLGSAPTAADAAKVLSVDSSGGFVLITPEGGAVDVNPTVQNLGVISVDTSINASNGPVVKFQPSGSISISIVSSAASGKAQDLFLHITNGGSATIVWPSSLKWNNDIAPSLQTTGEDLIAVHTENQGASWQAYRVWTLYIKPIDIWDGTVGTVPTPVNNVYTVNTCAELAAIAAAVNAGTLATAGNTFRLACNLDLNNKEWTACAMDGTFDGAGYEILNFTQTSANSNATHGFFTTIGSSGVIKNVTLTGAITSAADGDNHSAGTIAITNNGTIKNCVINVSYTITTSFNFGQSFAGIVNKNVGTIENVLRTGKMSGGSLSTMIGVCYSNYGTIHNVVSIGDITAGNKAFGLTNLSNQNNSVFSNCVVVGNIGNYGLGNQFNVIRNCVFVGTSGESGYNISSWGTEENVFATSGQSYGCTIVATADAPAAAILLDKYEHSVGNIPVTATAYPTTSSQAGTVEVTAGSGMTVSPSEISSGAETEIAVTGTGDLTFAVPAAVLAAATNKCSPTVALAVA